MGLNDSVFCTRQVHLQPIIFHNNVMQLGCILSDMNTPDEMFLYAVTHSGYNYIVCVSKKLMPKTIYIYHVQISTNNQ